MNQTLVAVCALLSVVVIGSSNFVFAETDFPSPLQQMKNVGVLPDDVRCNDDKVLMIKSNAGKPICVKETSVSVLEQRNFAIIVHDSSFYLKEDLDISAEFPYESRYVTVLDSQMHYIDEGSGDVVLFIHGNPTSSYLWRNIIPHVSDDARVIAVDLIGMGKSDKPDIDYSYDDHYRYLTGFINELDLKNITLVIHDWGSGLGFNYAANNPENIKGIAFMEALLMPMPGYDAMPSSEIAETFQNFRTPGIGEELIMNQNVFIEQMLPGMITRELTEEEMDNYRQPYPTPESRKPIWKWPNEVPIGGEPKHTHNIVTSYNQWLQTTDTPMLMLYATPGALGNEMAVQWAESNISNLKTVHIGEGFHFIQEDNPDAIGKAISEWYQEIVKAEKFEENLQNDANPVNDVLWSDMFGSESHDHIHAITTFESSGNVILAGRTFGSLPGFTIIESDNYWEGSADSFLRAYDSQVEELWTKPEYHRFE